LEGRVSSDFRIYVDLAVESRNFVQSRSRKGTTVPVDRTSKDWLPDEAIETIVCERITEPELTDEQLARRILMRAAPGAAKNVAHLAMYSTSEQIRLAASRYIIDGVVGGTFKGEGGEQDVLLSLVQQLAANDPAERNARMQ
jgi:hypothetical protein